MEEQLLYIYLNWRKEHNNSSEIKNKASIFWILTFIITGVCFIAAIVLYAINPNLLTIPAVILLLSTIIIDFLSNLHQIKQSNVSFERYNEYCNNIYAMLSNFNISTKDNINELIGRLCSKKNEIQTIIEKKFESIDKWIQTLIIPTTLAIISGTFALKSNITEASIQSFVLLTFLILIYLTVRNIISIMSFVNNIKIDNYGFFVEDLQGILDIKWGMMSSNKDLEHTSEASSVETQLYQ